MSRIGRRGADGRLTRWHLLPATQADLLWRLGRTDQAHDAYCRARDLAPTGAERRFLDRRLAELAASRRYGAARRLSAQAGVRAHTRLRPSC